MELTILLSKVFGIYLIVGGLAIIVRRKYFMSVVHQWVDHGMLRMIVAIAEFVAGLFIIMTHNIWETLPEGIVSAAGWILMLEGAFYLFASEKLVRKLMKMFNTKMWYIVGGLLSIALGAYLINFGFALELF